MKKNLSHIALLLFASLSLHAQQLPQYTQYMLNDFVMNPAIAGVRPYYEVKSSNRYQWIGINDAPRTYILSVSGPNKTGKIGMGGSLFTDIVGPTRRIGLSYTYAYHLKISETMRLSMGLSAGVLQFAIDASKINLHDDFDQVISSGYQSVLVPDFGCGVYLYHERFYVGLAVPQIYQTKLKFFDYLSDNKSFLATHYYSSAGYKQKIGEDFLLEPCVLVKYVYPAPVKADIGVKVTYKEDFWLGTAFRTHDAICVMAGFRYKKNLIFGYSYDFTTTNIKNYSTGTHELMIALRFKEKE